MPVATKLPSSAKSVSEPRAILELAGNRVWVSEDQKRNNDGLEIPRRPTKQMPKIPQSVVTNNVSTDSTCSSNSSSNSSAKNATSRRTVRRNGLKPAKIVPDGASGVSLFPKASSSRSNRCDWITPNSDSLYASFHDEEWGVPVHEDRKLFEWLVFSQALAELSWPAILNFRDVFRKLFKGFDPSVVAQITERELLPLKINGNPLLSEPKLRAILGNASQILKVQQEFGSFSNYCWIFVNHKPIRNGFRYGRQVPVKTPKAELISKDLMRRGFQCVGPTVVYSFMQAAGLVNDHLITCFRHRECNVTIRKELKTQVEVEEVRNDTTLEQRFQVTF